MLVALMDDLRRQLDKGGSAVLVLLDLSAAFDMVDHELLASHLAGVGIRGTALQWLCSFVRNCTQRVEMGEERSRLYQLPCRVPQGGDPLPYSF